MKVDLHIHSDASDGTLSALEIIKLAKNKHFGCIAVTDHDTVANVGKAIRLGKQFEIEVIPAIELNCTWEQNTIEILGYFIDYKNKDLLKLTREIKKARIIRIKLMIKKLNKIINKKISFKEVRKIADGQLTAAHLAQAMVAKKIVKNFREAFNKYLASGKPAYVRRAITFRQAMGAINKARGIPVLAHPGLYEYIKDKDNFVKELRDSGVKGIEVFFSCHSKKQTAYFKRLANKYGLLITGGSDFHGKIHPHKLGDVNLDYKYVQKLKEFKNSHI